MIQLASSLYIATDINQSWTPTAYCCGLLVGIRIGIRIVMAALKRELEVLVIYLVAPDLDFSGHVLEKRFLTWYI